MTEFHDRIAVAAVIALTSGLFVVGLATGDFPRTFVIGAAATPLAMIGIALLRRALVRRIADVATLLPPGVWRRVLSWERYDLPWPVRVLVIGSFGVPVNLAVFTAAFELFHFDYRAAATLGFAVAGPHNFAWHRYWRLGRARDDRNPTSASPRRLMLFALTAFVAALVVLILLVEVADLSPLLAQPLSLIAGAPFNLAGARFGGPGGRPTSGQRGGDGSGRPAPAGRG